MSVKYRKHYLFVIPSLTTGGAERVVSVLSNQLVKLGKIVTIIIYYDTPKKYATINEVTIQNLSNGNEDDYLKMSYLKRIPKLRRMIKESKPDYIIPFLPQVCAQVTLAVPEYHSRIIYTIRNNPDTSPASAKERKLRDFLVCHSKKTLIQNEEQRSYFSSRTQKKLYVLPNPISDNAFEKKSTPLGTGKIVAVGRLVEQKNFQMLLRAFYKIEKLFPDATLTIYGEGKMRKQLEDDIEKHGMSSRISLPGFTDNILDVYESANIFVLSSNFEGMPNALMEAMAVGIPCVSTKCPTGPSSLITDGINGFLIDVDDYTALANTLSLLLSNLSLCKNLSLQSREVMKKYNVNEITKTLVKICEE